MVIVSSVIKRLCIDTVSNILSYDSKSFIVNAGGVGDCGPLPWRTWGGGGQEMAMRTEHAWRLNCYAPLLRRMRGGV